MATLHQTAKVALLRAPRANFPRPGISYAGSVIEMQLRQALARAEALLREKDLQIHAVLAWREAAVNHLAGLTRRQRQIMELVLAGQPSKNIAADLGISQRTVENHRASIMKKTGSKCLPALARMALAAAWDDAAAPSATAGWRNTGGPGFAPTRQALADWHGGSALELTAPGAANRSWSSGNGAVAFSGSPMPNGRQGASVTNFPAPARCRSK
jgi:DNA-binding CsgD family transcriptional regulator